MLGKMVESLKVLVRFEKTIETKDMKEKSMLMIQVKWL